MLRVACRLSVIGGPHSGRVLFASRLQTFCNDKNNNQKTAQFWENLMGVPVQPGEIEGQQRAIDQHAQLRSEWEERLQKVADHDQYLDREVTEEEFNNEYALKKGERRMSLHEYAETLQGADGDEFREWLAQRDALDSDPELASTSQANTEPESQEEEDNFLDSDSAGEHEPADDILANPDDLESGTDMDDVDLKMMDLEGEMSTMMKSFLTEEMKETPMVSSQARAKKKATTGKTMTQEELDKWEQEQAERTEKVLARKHLRRHRINLSIGSVTLPQGLRDRITNLIHKYHKKRSYLRPTLHLGKEEYTDKEKQYMEESASHLHRTHIPSRAENRKMIRQALHAHIFADPVDAEQMVTTGTFPQIIFGKPESLAYVENFTTGQYGIIHRILHEIEVLRPHFTPRMILDFGSGPGTTFFAADEIWGDNIMKHVLAVEPSSAMLDISQTLTKFDNRIQYRRFLSMGKEAADYDMVVSSCSFTYLQTPRERRDTIRSLWRSVRPGGLLVFSEIGSPVGFQMVKHIRSILLEEDVPGTVIAPCPHQFTCPMGEKNWCHIKQRTFTLPHERKHSARSYRDVPFSYIVVEKPSVLGARRTELGSSLENLEEDKSSGVPDVPFSRIVRQPRKRGGHVYLDLCTPEGTLKETIVTKRQGTDFYSSARKAKWGDGFVDPTPTIATTQESEEGELYSETDETETDKE